MASDHAHALTARTNGGERSPALSDLVPFFLLSCRSPHTRRAYAKDVADFLSYCEDLGTPLTDVREISERLLLLWMRTLERKHTLYEGAHERTVQSTVKRKVSGLASLLSFALARGIIERNCADLLVRPRTPGESRTNALTAQETLDVLDWLERAWQDALHAAGRAEPSQQASAHKNARSAHLRLAILHTLLTVGMRVDELCQLRIGDLEADARCARLHMTAKGGESHAPIIAPATHDVIVGYIAACRAGARPEDLLFVRAQNVRVHAPLSQTAVFAMMRAACAGAGISKKVSPHSCRATVATALHKSGVPIGHIQELLNHKQITTTALYIKKADALDEAAARKIAWDFGDN